MSRDVSLYLEDILEACEKLQRYMQDVDEAQFRANSMLFDAVVRNIEIIGEAARQLPEHVLEEMFEAPWRNIIGMRNILAHAYFGVDIDIVWDVATHEAPRLEAVIQQYLGK